MQIIAITTKESNISKILETDKYRLVISHPTGKYYARFSDETGFESECVRLISEEQAKILNADCLEMLQETEAKLKNLATSTETENKTVENI